MVSHPRGNTWEQNPNPSPTYTRVLGVYSSHFFNTSNTEHTFERTAGLLFHKIMKQYAFHFPSLQLFQPFPPKQCQQPGAHGQGKDICRSITQRALLIPRLIKGFKILLLMDKALSVPLWRNLLGKRTLVLNLWERRGENVLATLRSVHLQCSCLFTTALGQVHLYLYIKYSKNNHKSHEDINIDPFIQKEPKLLLCKLGW